MTEAGDRLRKAAELMERTDKLARDLVEMIEADCPQMSSEHRYAYTVGYLRSMLAHACYLNQDVEDYAYASLVGLERVVRKRAQVGGGVDGDVDREKGEVPK